jgi:hypothetical protein
MYFIVEVLPKWMNGKEYKESSALMLTKKITIPEARTFQRFKISRYYISNNNMGHRV